MMDIAVRIEGPSKCCYFIKRQLDQSTHALLLFRKKASHQFLDLRYISVETERGECPSEGGIVQFEDKYECG
jgi:hypothetical protein